jgi:hypothetical protein
MEKDRNSLIVEVKVRVMVFNATFNNISVISWYVDNKLYISLTYPIVLTFTSEELSL